MLSNLYGIPYSRQLGKSILASLVDGWVPTKFAHSVTAPPMKVIPLVGTGAGLLTTPAFAAASTYAVGKVFVQHFESGGTFLTFEPDQVREHYQTILHDELEKGQQTGVGTKLGTTLGGDPAAA